MSNPHLTALGNFVRPRRAKKGISLKGMADQMGLSPASLSQYEVHKSPFPDAWLERIGDVLELSDAEKRELASLRMKEVINTKCRQSDQSDDFMAVLLENYHLLNSTDLKNLKDVLTETLTAKSKGFDRVG